VNYDKEFLKHMLDEFKNADDDQVEFGGMEIYGEDAAGNEGSFFMKTQDICNAALVRIRQLEGELRKENQ
jgi:hypothetical protein